MAVAAAGILLFGACAQSPKDSITAEFSQSFPLEIPEENSLMTRWAGKEVLASKLIEDMEGNAPWTVKGIATLEYTTERAIDGTHSLRYHTSMLDRAHIESPSERSPWGSFGGQQGGDASFTLAFPEPQDWSDYNRISIWVYIHPSKNPNVHFFLDVVNDGTDYNTVTPRHDTNIDIRPGAWHNVVWEIDYLPRDRVKSFTVFQTLIGYDREMGEQYVTIDFDRLELQKVVPDHYSGWDIPKGQIAFSHTGYRPADRKTAFSHPGDASTFSIVDETDGKTVFTGPVGSASNKGNDFSVLDFSTLTKPGTYRIRYGETLSQPFPVDEKVWLHPMFSAINFYFCQRCGYTVPGIHSECHQDWQGFHEEEKKVINGGWHDAGDMSQGYYRTALGSYTLMRSLDAVKDDPALKELASKLRDEAAWGIEWLLKTRFHDGYHISWARQRIYSDNEIGTYDDVVIQAQNIPWENFLGTADLLDAAVKLPQFADRTGELEAAAVDNWEQAMQVLSTREVVSYLEASWGAIASIKLYGRFGDDKYREAALDLGEKLLRCQETVFQEGIPLTGYFFNDTRRERLIHNNHGAFNEAPLLAYKELCRAFPDEGLWIRWYAGAATYSEYFMKRGSAYAAPYDMVPNSVFRKADILRQNRRPGAPAPDPGAVNYSLIQYNDGTQLNDSYALRTFPIWSGDLFHGGTSCHLSTAWALAEAAALLNDKDAMYLVQEQLEWTLGRNPFGQSFMYGVGYNFAPLFVYCTRNIVGALPVGIDSFRNDEPFWHGSAYATSKEIWIAPVNRFMGTVATFLGEKVGDGHVAVRIAKAGDGTVTATFAGTGKHEVTLRGFNAETEFTTQEIDLSSDKTVSFSLVPKDETRPAVAALIVDGNLAHTTLVTNAKY